MSRLEDAFWRRVEKRKQAARPKPKTKDLTLPKSPTFEYRYVSRTGDWQIRVMQSPTRVGSWRTLTDFNGQTHAELVEYMQKRFGPRLLACKDVV